MKLFVYIKLESDTNINVHIATWPKCLYLCHIYKSGERVGLKYHF